MGFGCQTTSATGSAGQPKEREVSPRAGRLFQDAVRAVEEGRALGVMDWDHLARKFEDALEEDDEIAEAWFNLGVAHEQRADAGEARGAYERAIRLKPSLYVARENLGVLLEEGGDPAGAAEQYKAILRDAPDHAGARARLAGLFLDGGDPGRALELAREALLRDPKNLVARKILLRVHLERGELDVAKLVALRAQQQDERDPEIPYWLGQILERQGDGLAAMAQYRRSLERDPGFAPARARLASDALGRHAYPDAVAHYEVLTRSQPKSSEARLDYGTALFGEGKIDEALAAFLEAQELDPVDVRPSFSIAYIYHRSKDEPETAVGYYRRFVSGSAINLPGSHAVFPLLREAEQLVQLRLEARLAEEAAKAEAEAAAKREIAEAAAAAEEARAAEERAARAAEDRDTLPADEAPTPVAAPKASPKPAPRKVTPAPTSQPAQASPPSAVDPDEPVDEF